MAPKLDIRSFFRPKPSDVTKKGDAGSKRATDEAPQEEPAKKKSKFFDEKANGKPVEKVAEPDKKRKTPQNAPKPKGSPVANGKTAATAKGQKGNKQETRTTPKRNGATTKRKSLVIDDDSDDDDDFEDEPPKPAPMAKNAPPPKGKPGSAVKKAKKKLEDSDEDDFVYDLGSEEDSDEDLGDDSDSEIEEVVVKKGKQAAKAPPRGQRGAPAALKASPKAAPPAQPPKPAAKPKPTPEPHFTQTPKAKPRARGKTEDAMSPDVQAAVAAVDAAIQKLPPLEELKYSVLVADPGAGWNQRGNEEPPNRGTKEMPRGHPECLHGKTFVITGVLDSLERPEAEDLIKRHGGRVTGSVSGKTSFLLVGMESGSTKTRQAKEKRTKFIDEDGLLSLIKAAPAPEHADDGFAQPSRASQAGPAPTPAVGAARLPPAGIGNRGVPSSFGGRPSVPAVQAGPSRPPPAPGGQLWVERHKPQNLNDLVANNAAVTALREWLESWDAIHLHGQAPPPPKGRGAKPKDFSKKAVLLSGPPGIGKTSSALIVTRALGFLPIEVNASDTRNKSDNEVGGGIKGKLANSIKELATNRAIGVGTDGKAKRICLIMDEVDGMSGGDRGGVTELINTIKRSKVPIIAICNDKYNQKLKSLKNHVMELDYRKPMSNQIVPRLRAICAKEGLQVSDAALQSLAEGANGDIRLILGQLQMIRLRRTRVEYDDVRKGGGMGTTKDADMSPFEAARRLMAPESKALSIGDRMDMVYQDADLVPLLIQENYVNHRPSVARDDVQRLRLVAKAADFLSLGDVVNRNVRQRQNWSLSPAAVLIGSVAPAAYMRGNRETFGLYPGEMNFPRFSAWLGQNSSSGKQRRLLGELHTRMTASGHLSADRTGLRTSYLPTLRKSLTAPLVGAEKEGIEPVINIMHEYCLERDDIDFIMDVTKFKSKGVWAADPFKDIPSLVKSAFTRQVNQQKQAPRTTIMVDEFKKGRKKKGAAVDADIEGEGEEEGSAEVEGEASLLPKEGEEAEQKDEEEDEEDLPNPVLQAKRAKQLAKHGIVFQAKEDPKAAKARGKAAASKKLKAAGKATTGRGKK